MFTLGDPTVPLLLATMTIILAWQMFLRRPSAPTECGNPPNDADRGARETLERLQALTARAAETNTSPLADQLAAELAEADDDEAGVLSSVAHLIQQNERMQQQLSTAEERLQAQARQIESHAVEARTDALTQVANRRALDDQLHRCLEEFNRRGSPATLMLLDVDHFKKFNDTHGHQAGDEVLRSVARTLRLHLGDAGFLARYGGEEFAVVFPGLPVKAAAPLGERVRQAVPTCVFRFSGREQRITASAGLAEFKQGDTEKDLVRRADEALYASKNAGRNCGHYSDGRTNHKIQPKPVEKPVQAAPLGDEWLYQGDAAAAQPEKISQVTPQPVFFDGFIRHLANFRRSGTPLSILLVQIDGHPRITAEFGAAAAEAHERITAQLINAIMRDIDQVGRVGADTFSLLLPGLGLQDAGQIAERLRVAAERCRLPKRAGASHFTVSIGAVEADTGDDMRHVLERARHALERAVNQGRNRICSAALTAR